LFRHWRRSGEAPVFQPSSNLLRGTQVTEAAITVLERLNEQLGYAQEAATQKA